MAEVKETAESSPDVAQGWPGESRSFLVIDAGYFLTQEVIRALKAEGHRVAVIPLRLPDDSGRPDPEHYVAFLQILVHAAVYLKPDALLTINHLGFDADGRLTELLGKMNLPALIWYVDSPRYILLNHLANVSDRVGIFLWDQGYEPWMRQIGYQNVHALPLATDPEIFDVDDETQGAGGTAPLVFVGDSMTLALNKAFGKLPPHLRPDSSDGSGGRIAKLADRFCQVALSLPRRKPAWEIFSELGVESLMEAVKNCSHKEDGNPEAQRRHQDQEVLLNLESALMQIATRRQRVQLIRDIAGSPAAGDAIIYGDEGWKQVVNGVVQVRPPVDYYRHLPKIYCQAGAVVNLTSLQMPSALNQRCYDVPAAGGFLITDAQETLYQQFDPDEVVAFRSVEELLDKWNDFSRRPDDRQAVIEKGRRRILEEHTYRHRVRQMVRVAQSWFA